jgi:hypothetical protein
MLIFNDAAKLIVSHNFIELPIGYFNQEFNLLVVGSIIIPDLACNQGTEHAPIRHVVNESESK